MCKVWRSVWRLKCAPGQAYHDLITGMLIKIYVTTVGPNSGNQKFVTARRSAWSAQDRYLWYA